MSAHKRSDGEKWLLKHIAMALGLLILSLLLPANLGIRVNLTESMPRGLYELSVLSHPLKKGDIVAACLPYSAARLGEERGYLGSGI